MSSPKPTVAFFGATGGCLSVTLAMALKAGYNCTALIRKPERLNKALQDLDVPVSTISENLTTITGNVKDSSDVKRALSHSGHLPDTIVVGVGALPKLMFSLRTPITSDDEHLCEDGNHAIVTALQDLQAEGVTKRSSSGTRKPLIVMISSTGIGDGQRDVPLAMLPLYHWLLTQPHRDKRAAEKVLYDASSSVADFCLVRPTWFLEGESKGLDNVRAGWEWAGCIPESQRSETAPGPQLGYGIRRADVGGWMFENLLNKEANLAGKCFTLTY